MQRACKKCGHLNPSATGDALEACPDCGAIYSRVEQAMAAKATQPRAAAPRGIEDFAQQMREASLYPTFRGLVHLIYLALLVLSVLALAMGLVALIWGEGVARVLGFLGCVFFAVFTLVIAKASKEGALMLADLSDAAVQIAARQRNTP